MGFRPGIHSIVDGLALVVMDIDVRGGEKYAKEAYAAAETLLQGRPMHVISGSGFGRHAYLLCPVDRVPPKAAGTLRQSDIRINNKPAWMIELLSTGKNVVLPPSIHPDTGGRYTWVDEERLA